MDFPEIGGDYVYNATFEAPIERVKVIAIERQKPGYRAVVERIGRERAGEIQTVPGKRLKVPWSQKAEFQTVEKVWNRFRWVDLTETEEWLLHEFFEKFIPPQIARVVVGAGHPYGPQLHPVAQIDDIDALKDVVGMTDADFLKQAGWAEVHGEMVLSPLE